MKSSKEIDASFDFLKWYMSTDVQSKYSTEMESILGPAAKVQTANKDSLKKMTWSKSEYDNLMSQYSNVGAIPDYPGGYYLTRVMTFAFNRIYNASGTQNMSENPVEVLKDYVYEFNDELKRKQEEFKER